LAVDLAVVVDERQIPPLLLREFGRRGLPGARPDFGDPLFQVFDELAGQILSGKGVTLASLLEERFVAQLQ
jgi:hypothetical protein